MPPAGPDRSQRALAHYRWAERYSHTGEPFRSIAHMERALDYTRRPKTRFGGVTFPRETIEDVVREVMWKHTMAALRNGQGSNRLLVSFKASDIGTRKYFTVSLEGKEDDYGSREWNYYDEQPELSLQSIAEALDDVATELGMTADLRVKLQMCMGEAYGKVIERMRAEGGDATESAKRPRP
jgi:hypothetical protein